MALAKQFYAAAFGWGFNDYGPDYAGIKDGEGEAGGLRLEASVTTGGPLVILYSRDLEASLAGCRLDEIDAAIENFFADSEIDMLSVTPDDFRTSIASALAAGDSDG